MSSFGSGEREAEQAGSSKFFVFSSDQRDKKKRTPLQSEMCI